MVYSTVTRKCSVLTQPTEGRSRVCQLAWHVPFECSSSRERGLFSTHSLPSLLILSQPGNASRYLRSLLMVTSVLEDRLSLALEKRGYRRG